MKLLACLVYLSALSLHATALPLLAGESQSSASIAYPGSIGNNAYGQHSTHLLRHLLQFQSIVLDETPTQQMERIQRELQLAQRVKEEGTRETTPAATDSATTDAGTATWQRIYLKKAQGSSFKVKTRDLSEDGELEVIPPPELSSKGALLQHLDQQTGALEDQEQGEHKGEPPGGMLTSAASPLLLQGCQLSAIGGREALQKKEHYGSWTLCRNGIHKGAVVYSFGIGSDVSFDLALCRLGCKVYGFDPTKTPEYVQNVFKKNHGLVGFPAKFKFFQVGIGTKDETIPFLRSKSPGSMTALPLSKVSNKLYEDVGFQAPVQTLSTCRRQLHHRRIDILKIDAEGVELGLCESKAFFLSLAKVTQVLIEFHDRLTYGGRALKNKCIKKIKKLGFTLVYQTAGAKEVSFARLA